MNPTVILIAVAVWLATTAGAFFYGEHVESLSCAAANAKADGAVDDQKDKDALKQNAPSVALEQGNAQAEKQYRAISKKIDALLLRPSYSIICLDDDGLRAANDALTGKTTAAGQSNSAVQQP
jgi:hypothetical protein